jgi:hypothetical protein
VIATGRIMQTVIPGSSQSNRDRADLVALRRLGTVEDCAKVVEFLATDLSDYLTGAVIRLTEDSFGASQGDRPLGLRAGWSQKPESEWRMSDSEKALNSAAYRCLGAHPSPGTKGWCGSGIVRHLSLFIAGSARNADIPRVITWRT